MPVGWQNPADPTAGGSLDDPSSGIGGMLGGLGTNHDPADLGLTGYSSGDGWSAFGTVGGSGGGYIPVSNDGYDPGAIGPSDWDPTRSPLGSEFGTGSFAADGFLTKLANQAKTNLATGEVVAHDNGFVGWVEVMENGEVKFHSNDLLKKGQEGGVIATFVDDNGYIHVVVAKPDKYITPTTLTWQEFPTGVRASPATIEAHEGKNNYKVWIQRTPAPNSDEQPSSGSLDAFGMRRLRGLKLRDGRSDGPVDPARSRGGAAVDMAAITALKRGGAFDPLPFDEAPTSGGASPAIGRVRRGGATDTPGNFGPTG